MGESGTEGTWEGTWRSREREDCNRDMLCEKKKSIFNRREKFKNQKRAQMLLSKQMIMFHINFALLS